MEKSLKDIIKEIGNEYEMEDEIINEIINKLHKQFYIKLKHMKNLSLEIWKSLDLPINLFYVLNELYQSSLSDSKNNNLTQPEKIENILPSEKIKLPEKQNLNAQKKEQIVISNTLPVLKLQPQKIMINNETNIMNQIIKQNNLNKIYGNNSIQSTVHNDLCILLTEINDIDISKKLFKSIYTIISNISHNPNIERYKKFNIIKLLSSFRYKNIIPFFSNIGFKNTDDYMILQEDSTIIKKISIVSKELNQFIKDNKLAEINFNPYKGSISSIGDNSSQIKKAVENEINFDLHIANADIEVQANLSNMSLDCGDNQRRQRSVICIEIGSKDTNGNVTISRDGNIEEIFDRNSDDEKIKDALLNEGYVKTNTIRNQVEYSGFFNIKYKKIDHINVTFNIGGYVFPFML